MKLLVIYGSVREGRQGIRAARFVTRTATERGHEAVLIDPEEYDFGLLKKMYKSYDAGTAPGAMERLREHILSADGVIVVSGEYNHSIPAPLTNLMSHFLEEWGYKPSLITTYSSGSFGGIRAGVQLRSFLSELGMITVSHMVAFPNIGGFNEDGTPPDERAKTSLNKALDELDWYADAIRSKKDGN